MEFTLKNYSSQFSILNSNEDLIKIKCANNINTTFRPNALTLLISTRNLLSSFLIKNFYGNTYKNSSIKGNIYYGNKERDINNDWFNKSAYVNSDKTFYPNLTVFDAIYFAVKFYLSSNISLITYFKNDSHKTKLNNNNLICEKIENIMELLKITYLKDKTIEKRNNEEILRINLAIALIKECEIMFVDFYEIKEENKYNQIFMEEIILILKEHTLKGNTVIVGYNIPITPKIYELTDGLCIMIYNKILINNLKEDIKTLFVKENIYNQNKKPYLEFLNDIVNSNPTFYNKNNENLKNMYAYMRRHYNTYICINRNIDQKIEKQILLGLDIHKINKANVHMVKENCKMIQKEISSIVAEDENSVGLDFNFCQSMIIFKRKMSIIKNNWSVYLFYGSFIFIGSFIFSFFKKRYIWNENYTFIDTENINKQIFNYKYQYFHSFIYLNFFHFFILSYYPEFRKENFEDNKKKSVFHDINTKKYSYFSYLFGEYLAYFMFYTLVTFILYLSDLTFKIPNIGTSFYLKNYLLGSILVFPCHYIIYMSSVNVNPFINIAHSNIYTLLRVYIFIMHVVIVFCIYKQKILLVRIILQVIAQFSFCLPNIIVNFVFIPEILKRQMQFRDEVKDVNVENYDFDLIIYRWQMKLAKLFAKNENLNLIWAGGLLFMCFLLHVYICVIFFKKNNKNTFRLKTNK